MGNRDQRVLGIVISDVVELEAALIPILHFIKICSVNPRFVELMQIRFQNVSAY